MKKERYIGLDGYIIDNLGRIPICSMEVYQRVSDNYGYVEPRTFFRHLKSLPSIVIRSRVEKHTDYGVQSANGYSLKQIKTKPVFQRQYIAILRSRVEMIQCL